jgi:hypothetical protein
LVTYDALLKTYIQTDFVTKSKCSTCGGLAKKGPETNRVVFQRGPKDLQNITLRAFNAFVDLEALKAFGSRDHGGQTTFNSFVKSGLLAGVDADVG